MTSSIPHEERSSDRTVFLAEDHGIACEAAAARKLNLSLFVMETQEKWRLIREESWKHPNAWLHKEEEGKAGVIDDRETLSVGCLLVFNPTLLIFRLETPYDVSYDL